MISVCFVCLGNICRSPTAEGVLRHLVARHGLERYFSIESAGTAAYHQGEPPDKRSVAAAKKRGVRVTGRARRFLPADFDRFDYVLALDENNYESLQQIRPPATRAELALLLAFDPASKPGASVPDPYYGGAVGFDHVLDLCERACEGFLQHVRREHGIHG